MSGLVIITIVCVIFALLDFVAYLHFGMRVMNSNRYLETPKKVWNWMIFPAFALWKFFVFLICAYVLAILLG